jgi:hypothetical protein
MPGLDRTGPRGLGSMTGGGFGYCSGYAQTPYPPYGYNQSYMPQFSYANPNYTQNSYGYQPQTGMPIQQPYYGYGMGRGLGLGLGWGRGFGMGMAYRRGMGRGARGGYWF